MVDPVNYVMVEVGKPRVMRFDKYAWDNRTIPDPRLGFSKTVRTLVFHVTELDLKPADTTFSVVSTVLQAEFQPYLDNGSYATRRFTIIKEAGGYSPPKISRAEPV